MYERKVYRRYPDAHRAIVASTEPTSQPGRHQVLVRVRAMSLNHRDLRIVEGRNFRGPVAHGIIPLSDGAGEVVQLGEEVTRLKLGDRVASLFMPRWLDGDLDSEKAAAVTGTTVDGMLTTYRLFDENEAVILPDHLSFAEGATLPCAAVTAWNALNGERSVRPGDVVLTLGTGGVSTFVILFANAAGAQVIVTSSSDEKLERASALGAWRGINYVRSPDWSLRVREFTEGRGVDHVVETAGAGTLPRSIASCAMGGRIHLVGTIAEGTLDASEILKARVHVRGMTVGPRTSFEMMNRAIAQHQLRPVVDRVFNFDEAIEAFRQLGTQSNFGKIVIAVA